MIAIKYNGNEYASLVQACKELGINYGTARYRLRMGYTIEETFSLTRGIKFIKRGCEAQFGKKCVDHLGNKYETQKEMCDAYGISLSNYVHRIQRGWTLEEALSPADRKGRKSYKCKGKECMDHAGNKYDSIIDMCKAYNVKYSTYMSRINLGWPIEKALITPTGPIGHKGYCCKDHLGNEYSSIREMCRAYNVNSSVFLYRRKHGKSIKEALTSKRTYRKKAS